MVIGTLEIALRLEGCRSLKDKREFQVSIAEVADQKLWGNACIGVATVSNNAKQAESVLQHVVDMFDAHASIEIQSVSKEMFRL